MIKYISIEEYFNHDRSNNKVFVIDSNLYKNWKERINKIINGKHFFILESTEKNKNINTYNKIMDFLFEKFNTTNDYHSKILCLHGFMFRVMSYERKCFLYI